MADGGQASRNGPKCSSSASRAPQGFYLSADGLQLTPAAPQPYLVPPKRHVGPYHGYGANTDCSRALAGLCAKAPKAAGSTGPTPKLGLCSASTAGAGLGMAATA